MATTPSFDSLTLDVPRITETRFKQLLATKNSPALPSASKIYQILVQQGVEPSFALAQYRVESQYGTAGHAVKTGSWGNMLYDSALTLLASGTYAPGNGYTYATYDTFEDAITDYCRYIHHYKDVYELETIYEATARWIGKPQGSTGHVSYVTIIVDDMIRYEYPSGGYVSGDEMIYIGPSFNRVTGRFEQKYPITIGLQLYRGTDLNMPLKKYSGTPGNAWWLGFVNGGRDWGAVVIGTTIADPDATVVYLYKPSASKIITV